MAVYPLVSVITVNYHQAALTCALLDSLQRSDYPRLEVWVVDNGSREDIAPLLKHHYPEVHYVVSRENLGFAGGNNLALTKARGAYLLLINNDAEIEADAIGIMVERLRENEEIGVIAPKIRYYEQPEVIQYAGFTKIHPLTARNRTIGQGETDRGQYDRARSTPYAHGAAMMISRTALDRVGLMPEEYFLYYEELDWCRQFRRAGFEILFEPRALVLHKESASVGVQSPLQTYYLHRNRILFMRRNASIWSRWGFYLFYGCFTLPRWWITYRFRQQPDHLRALVKAIKWHLFSKEKAVDPVDL